MRKTWLAAAVALCGCALAFPAYADGDSVDAHRVFRIQSDAIEESSSLVVSSVHEGFVYTANDSGDGATVYVLDSSNGQLAGRTELAGVDPTDIEAMAADGGRLVVADIGDNNANDPLVRIHRIDQPDAGNHVVEPDSIVLTYVDGPHDAESLVYDAERDQIFIVTKGVFDSAVYATSQGVFDRRQGRLRKMAPGPGLATDAVLLPDRARVVVRTYTQAIVYTYPDWREFDSFGLPEQRQGESIAVLPDGKTIWIGSEGESSPVLEFTLPASSNLPVQTTQTPRQQRLALRVGMVAGAVLLGVLVLLVALVVRHRRTPPEHR